MIDPVAEPATAGVPSNVLEARDLAVGYGAGPPALEGVSFDVGLGQRIGVIGPNGGGKTTLFRAILGELAPIRGSVHVRVRCALVPQTHRSRLDYPVSVLDVALMGTLSRIAWWRRPGRTERTRALEALDHVGLRELAGRRFGELSGGQQQRVLVARALVQDASLLLLDEPFTGVDPTSEERMLDLLERLAREGRSMLIATHEIDQVRDWDRVLCLNRTQIAFDVPGDTLTPAVVQATYPGSVVVLSHEGHDPHDPHERGEAP